MNINEFNQAAAERVIKSLRDRGAEVSGRVIVKTLTGMKPENSGQLHEGQPYEITSWATKSNVDMEGEVVLPNGGDVTSYFSKNRTLFVDHEYDIMKAVGKCRWLKMTPKGWLIKSALINNLDNPYRKQVQALADSGNIGMSVGMEIVDSGPPMVDERKSYGNARNIIRKWKLLEVSYTAMPMNGDCQSDLVQESEPQMSIETKNAKKIYILGQDMVVRIKELRSKDCGTGAGGFKPGNTCAAGDGSKEGMSQESRKKPKVGTNQEYQQISDRKDRVLERLYDVGKTGSDQQKEALISKLESFSSENLKPINKLEGSIDRRVNRAIDHVMRGIMDEFEGSLGVDKERKPILRHTDGINVLLDSLEQHLGKTKMYVWSKDCGTGAGGFKPGNTCASEQGKESQVADSTSEATEPEENRRSSSPALRAAKERASEISDMLDQKLDSDLGGNNYETYEDLNQLKRMNTSMNAWGMHSSMMQRYEEEKYLEIPESKGKTLPEQIDYQLQTARFNKEFIENELGRLERESPENYVRQVRRLDKLMQRFKMYVSSKDCGTGAGGFKPGNTCAAGDGSGSDEQLSERYTESEKQEISKMSELSSSDKIKLRDLQEIGKEVKSNYEFIDRQLLLVGGKPSKTAVADMNFRLAKTIAKIDGSNSANVINEARARVGKTTDPLQAAMLVTDDLNGQLRQKVKPFQRWDSKSDVSVSDQLKEATRVNNILRTEWDFRKSKKPKMYIFQKDCGTGAGGFKPGNTCAAGKDGESTNSERRGSDWAEQKHESIQENAAQFLEDSEATEQDVRKIDRITNGINDWAAQRNKSDAFFEYMASNGMDRDTKQKFPNITEANIQRVHQYAKGRAATALDFVSENIGNEGDGTFVKESEALNKHVGSILRSIDE